jgi:hypothetical protein
LAAAAENDIEIQIRTDVVALPILAIEAGIARGGTWQSCQCCCQAWLPKREGRIAVNFDAQCFDRVNEAFKLRPFAIRFAVICDSRTNRPPIFLKKAKRCHRCLRPWAAGNSFRNRFGVEI